MSHLIHFGPHYASKLSDFKQRGVDSVRIVADFDRTLTQAVVGGQQSGTSFNILAKSGLLSQNFARRIEELYAHYRPLELDHELDGATRFQKMSEWWEYTLQAIVNEKANRAALTKIAQSGHLVWRSGAQDLFRLSLERTIPIFIFSGGLGDIIQEHLTHSQLLHEMVNVFANFLEFNHKDEAAGYTKPVIHCENKNESIIAERGHAQWDKERKQIILLGDQLGDASMSQDSPSQQVLRVGFLNDDADLLLTRFQNAFDVVILGDGPLTFVTELLEELE